MVSLLLALLILFSLSALGVWLDKEEIANGAGSFARWIPAQGETIIEVEVSADIKRLAPALLR